MKNARFKKPSTNMHDIMQASYKFSCGCCGGSKKGNKYEWRLCQLHNAEFTANMVYKDMEFPVRV